MVGRSRLPSELRHPGSDRVYPVPRDPNGHDLGVTVRQLDLFADRTSARTVRANLLRRCFSSFAHVLMQALRRLGARGTELARAQCATLRLKRLKTGIRIRLGARRVWLSFSRSCPHADIFRQVLANLRNELELPRSRGQVRAIGTRTGVNDSLWKEICLGDRC